MKLNPIFDQKLRCFDGLRKTPYCPKFKNFELQICSLSRGHYFVLSRRHDPVPLISILLLCIMSWRIVETGTRSTSTRFDSQPRA
jgi:hypothetical protein